MTTADIPCIVPKTPFFCSWSGQCEVVGLSNLRKGADVDKVGSRSVFSEDRLRG